MSKFIPYRALVHEEGQQQKRRTHGLKSGTHVNFPDAEKGPFIVLKTHLEKPAYAIRLQQMKNYAEKLASLQARYEALEAAKKQQAATSVADGDSISNAPKIDLEQKTITLNVPDENVGVLTEEKLATAIEVIKKQGMRVE